MALGEIFDALRRIRRKKNKNFVRIGLVLCFRWCARQATGFAARDATAADSQSSILTEPEFQSIKKPRVIPAFMSEK